MTPASEAQRSVGTQRLATRDAKQLKAFGPSGLWAGFGGRVNRSQSVSEKSENGIFSTGHFDRIIDKLVMDEYS